MPTLTPRTLPRLLPGFSHTSLANPPLPTSYLRVLRDSVLRLPQSVALKTVNQNQFPMESHDSDRPPPPQISDVPPYPFAFVIAPTACHSASPD